MHYHPAILANPISTAADRKLAADLVAIQRTPDGTRSAYTEQEAADLIAAHVARAVAAELEKSRTDSYSKLSAAIDADYRKPFYDLLQDCALALGNVGNVTFGAPIDQLSFLPKSIRSSIETLRARVAELERELSAPINEAALRARNAGALPVGKGCEVAVAGTTARVAELERDEAHITSRISDDWERLHIEIGVHALDLSRDGVADLHAVTGEALALLAQSVCEKGAQ